MAMGLAASFPPLCFLKSSGVSVTLPVHRQPVW